MDLELTISGLCLIALKSDHLGAAEPLAIEVYCPQAAHHRALLTYDPEAATANFEPDLVVDENGKRFASVDLGGQVWQVRFGGGPEKFTASWGRPTGEVPKEGEKTWLNWVPQLADIGLEEYAPTAAGQLPKRATTRIVLAPGHLEAADIIKKADGSGYATWRFPAAGDAVRALANHLSYAAREIRDFKLTTTVGRQVYATGTGILRMAVSNDLAVVPEDYKEPPGALHHLKHLKGMDGITGDFKAPTEVVFSQTGKPICNSILVIHP